jgi:hypothetical protein
MGDGVTLGPGSHVYCRFPVRYRCNRRAAPTARFHRTNPKGRVGAVYCLVEAPDAEAAIALHREAHRLVVGDIVGVHESH